MRALELSIQGWTQAQIAADLHVSQPGVSKLLGRVEQRVLQELNTVVGRQKARQTLRLEHLYNEAMRAWDRSKADTTRRRQRKTQGGANGDATMAELVVEDEHGDPRYLEQARRALTDMTKLWGLDAPQKIDIQPSPSSDSLRGLTNEELYQRALQITERVRQFALKSDPKSLPECPSSDTN